VTYGNVGQNGHGPYKTVSYNGKLKLIVNMAF